MEKELFKIVLISFLLVADARTDECVDGTDPNQKPLKIVGVLGVVPITCVDDPNDSPDMIDQIVDAILDDDGHPKFDTKDDDSDAMGASQLWVPNGHIKSEKNDEPDTFVMPTNHPVIPSDVKDRRADENSSGTLDFKPIHPLIEMGDPTIKENITGAAHLNFQKPFTLCFDVNYLPANQTITSMMQDTLDDVPMPLVIAERDGQVYTNYPRFWKTAS